ncbi:MAG: hypothetical protein K8L97_28440 [Anaerolineae bacterium]|nr:hypothetical protein [Anaerolineae bacterium]
MTSKIVRRFFLQTILLFILYALAALLGAAKFLTPDDPLLGLPYHQISGLANLLLYLTALTGLLGGGIYIASQHKVFNETLLNYSSWAWIGLLVLVVLAGLLNILEGRNLLELPTFLDVVLIVLIVLIAGNILLGAPRVPVIHIWSIGILLSATCVIISLIPASDYLQDRVLRALAVGLNMNVAFPLATVALGFWLMHRFSNVTPGWADMGIYSVGGLVTVAGVLVSLTPLHILGAPEWTRTLGNLAVFVVPIAYLIFAAHSYKALSDRNATYTLAGHWYTLSLLLLLLGVGLLGGVQSAPGISTYTLGTRLTDLQSTFAGLAVVSMTLGVVNQGAAELKGHNRRLTGLSPFWLVAFGIIGGGLALGAAGVTQTITERQLSVGYLNTQTLIIPLYQGWFFGLVAVLLGAVIYGLTYWLRRPHEHSA